MDELRATRDARLIDLRRIGVIPSKHPQEVRRQHHQTRAPSSRSRLHGKAVHIKLLRNRFLFASSAAARLTKGAILWIYFGLGRLLKTLLGSWSLASCRRDSDGTSAFPAGFTRKGRLSTETDEVSDDESRNLCMEAGSFNSLALSHSGIDHRRSEIPLVSSSSSSSLSSPSSVALVSMESQNREYDGGVPLCSLSRARSSSSQRPNKGHSSIGGGNAMEDGGQYSVCDRDPSSIMRIIADYTVAQKGSAITCPAVTCPAVEAEDGDPSIFYHAAPSREEGAMIRLLTSVGGGSCCCSLCGHTLEEGQEVVRSPECGEGIMVSA